MSNGILVTAGPEEVLYYPRTGCSVRMVTGLDGHVMARHDYQPFGVEWPPAPGTPERVRFAGKEHDTGTGASGWMALDCFGARYLHSSIGRFTSVDPLVAADAAILDHRYGIASHMSGTILIATRIQAEGK